MRCTRRTLLVATVTAMVSFVSLPQSALRAAHSVGPVERYWDNDNNGYPNSYQTFYAYGSHWPDLAITRLGAAGNEWAQDTQGNPTVVRWTSDVTHTNRRIYLADSGHPNQPCPVSQNDYGVACIDVTFYAAGAIGSSPAHFRITHASITINARDYTSWIGSSFPPNTTYVDFTGVSTHELGHGMGLYDLSGESSPPCSYPASADWDSFYTMCTSAATRNATYYKRTVEPDDVAAMHAIYFGF